MKYASGDTGVHHFVIWYACQTRGVYTSCALKCRSIIATILQISRRGHIDIRHTMTHVDTRTPHCFIHSINQFFNLLETFHSHFRNVNYTFRTSISCHGDNIKKKRTPSKVFGNTRCKRVELLEKISRLRDIYHVSLRGLDMQRSSCLYNNLTTSFSPKRGASATPAPGIFIQVHP